MKVIDIGEFNLNLLVGSIVTIMGIFVIGEFLLYGISLLVVGLLNIVIYIMEVYIK